LSFEFSFTYKKLVTKEFIGKALLLRNLPLPLFSKEGDIASLWSASGGEVRWDFIINVFMLITYENYALPTFFRRVLSTSSGDLFARISLN
jgi:hypothetical protein